VQQPHITSDTMRYHQTNVLFRPFKTEHCRNIAEHCGTLHVVKKNIHPVQFDYVVHHAQRYGGNWY